MISTFNTVKITKQTTELIPRLKCVKCKKPYFPNGIEGMGMPLHSSSLYTNRVCPGANTFPQVLLVDKETLKVKKRYVYNVHASGYILYETKKDGIHYSPDDAISPEDVFSLYRDSF